MSYTDYKIEFGIDDEVQDRFGTLGTVCGYYIGRGGLRYELETKDKTWYEYPKYVKRVDVIGFTI